MNSMQQFPEAARRGFEDAKRYYARVRAGEIKEGEGIPPHPFPPPTEGFKTTEWHAYNAGWLQGIPE